MVPSLENWGSGFYIHVCTCVLYFFYSSAPAPAERDEVSGVTGEMGSGSQVSPISTPPFSVTSFPATKTPASKMASGGSGRASEHRVPIVCTGRTRDTTKLTTTPAADHDTMKMCTDTKRTGMRTNPTITHSVGLPGTPPPDRAAKTTSEVPPSPARKRQKVPSVALPQTVYTELGTQCQAELIAKLKWCTSKLEKSHSLEESILLCRLIAAAGEALKAMRELSLSSPTTDHSNDT